MIFSLPVGPKKTYERKRKKSLLSYKWKPPSESCWWLQYSASIGLNGKSIQRVERSDQSLYSTGNHAWIAPGGHPPVTFPNNNRESIGGGEKRNCFFSFFFFFLRFYRGYVTCSWSEGEGKKNERIKKKKKRDHCQLVDTYVPTGKYLLIIQVSLAPVGHAGRAKTPKISYIPNFKTSINPQTSDRESQPETYP